MKLLCKLFKHKWIYSFSSLHHTKIRVCRNCGVVQHLMDYSPYNCWMTMITCKKPGAIREMGKYYEM
jgi:hypothetical protein